MEKERRKSKAEVAKDWRKSKAEVAKEQKRKERVKLKWRKS